MCGIAGFFNSSIHSEEYATVIRKMLSHIQHRGPDEAGYYIDDNAAIGIVRLSIIDLKTGSQPISDQNKRYWIFYNGELYNYKEIRKDLLQKGVSFQTNSDTEVVLKSWIYYKERCLSQFNGAFAFAIYDSVEKSLFLARDRFGKRPLFYTEKDGCFIFASEMKAFLGYKSFNFKIDPKQLNSILAIWTPLPDQTCFENIKQLETGKYLVVNQDGIKTGNYDDLRFNTTSFNGTESDAIQLVRQSLIDSVNLRLRSDVEVALYLSGGIDSSVLTYIVSQIAKKQMHTFSVEFEEKEFDESEEQMKVVNAFSTNHTSILISYKDIVDNLQNALYHAEVPVFRTAFVPMFLLSKKVNESGIKVVLSGEGADEAFLGYGLFKDVLLLSSWNSLTNEERKGKLSKINPYLKHFSSENVPFMMGLYNQVIEKHMPGFLSHEMRFQNGRFSTRLLKPGFDDPFTHIRAYVEKNSYYNDLSPIKKAQWLEFKTLLAGYLLSTQGERMSLANAVENRCPFLDPNVVELASSVNLKFNDGFNEKYILKRAFETNLPSSIINRHKHPYRSPDSTAFVNHRPDYLELLLSEAELKKVGFLDSTFCQRLTKKIFTQSPEQISTKENQTFVFLITTLLLFRMFEEKKDIPKNNEATLNLVKTVDNTTKL